MAYHYQVLDMVIDVMALAQQVSIIVYFYILPILIVHLLSILYHYLFLMQNILFYSIHSI